MTDEGKNRSRGGRRNRSWNRRKGGSSGQNQPQNQQQARRQGGRRGNRRRQRREHVDDGKLSILIVGSGGREHALAWKLAQSQSVGRIFAAPGSSAMAEMPSVRCVDIKPDRIKEFVNFANRNKIGLTVVGPEAPLAAGMVDEFQKRNLPIFGPSKDAAELEWSKSYAKKFMRKYSIPTASFKVFDHPDIATTFCRTAKYPLVIKADGLAAGKGVVVVDNFADAIETIDDMMRSKRFGSAGNRIVIEDFIEGHEVSIMAICDGEHVWMLLPSQDHKRIGEGDTGPNTGGMGAFAPAPFVDEEFMAMVKERVMEACISGMAEEGRPYKGTLYAGLMLTEVGPKVLEFNCRFGDPETQAVLPLLESDLAELMLKVATKKVGGSSSKKSSNRRKNNQNGNTGSSDDKQTANALDNPGPIYLRDLVDNYPNIPDEETQAASQENSLRWRSGFAATVTVASGGYPGRADIGKRIDGLDRIGTGRNVVVFHAGTKRAGNVWTNVGGRVLSVTGLADSLKEALDVAYRAIKNISFPGMYYRRDIGFRVLNKPAPQSIEEPPRS